MNKTYDTIIEKSEDVVNGGHLLFFLCAPEVVVTTICSIANLILISENNFNILNLVIILITIGVKTVLFLMFRSNKKSRKRIVRVFYLMTGAFSLLSLILYIISLADPLPYISSPLNPWLHGLNEAQSFAEMSLAAIRAVFLLVSKDVAAYIAYEANPSFL